MRTYPKTVFSVTNDLSSQLKHIQSEVGEVSTALIEMLETAIDNASYGEIVPDKESLDALGVELHDVCQSCWTMLHILKDRYGLEIAGSLFAMKEKNEERGYYCEQT